MIAKEIGVMEETLFTKFMAAVVAASTAAVPAFGGRGNGLPSIDSVVSANDDTGLNSDSVAASAVGALEDGGVPLPLGFFGEVHSFPEYADLLNTELDRGVQPLGATTLAEFSARLEREEPVLQRRFSHIRADLDQSGDAPGDLDPMH